MTVMAGKPDVVGDDVVMTHAKNVNYTEDSSNKFIGQMREKTALTCTHSSGHTLELWESNSEVDKGVARAERTVLLTRMIHTAASIADGPVNHQTQTSTCLICLQSLSWSSKCDLKKRNEQRVCHLRDCRMRQAPEAAPRTLSHKCCRRRPSGLSDQSGRRSRTVIEVSVCLQSGARTPGARVVEPFALRAEPTLKTVSKQ
jgi:hypothetical protein